MPLRGSSGARSQDWAEVDPHIRGSGATAAGTRPFALPRTPSGELRLGRIVSGEAWPPGLARLDRVAALPLTSREDEARTRAGRSVLSWRGGEGALAPLCAIGTDGVVHWSVDPAGWIASLLAERYVEHWRRPLPSRIPLFNYARLPHSVRGALAGLSDPGAGTRSQPAGFPSVPQDGLVEELRALCNQLAGAPISAARWPGGRRAALTLSYDVDTEWILDDRRSAVLAEILEVEKALGFRSTWYVVAERLCRERHADALHALQEAGCELGAHGWNHDTKLAYLGSARQEDRMQKIRERFAGLLLEGVRTPWYARSPELFRVLARHFRYDSSVPNASGFFSTATNSGCCSFLPYRAAPGLIELPMTLPPDTAMPEETGYDLLLELCEPIIERSGVVVSTMHPQLQSANPAALARYLRFLETLAERWGDALWPATARDVVSHYGSAGIPGGSPS